ncbi:tRNA-dihydrouridine synthase [Candidatus Roizmanbacteria bacterium]|nr:tRNA-dihydrouridine synthase [Candidatus Roizmanbacteria bacterium]
MAIIGLSPMDGVTDAAFRYIVDKYGHPDIMFTEFTSVEGLAHGATALLTPLIHHQSSTPLIAQVFGYTPDDFYKAAFIAAEMGFSGIDINMGCPDRHITTRGGGAGLIRNPTLAKKIIEWTKRGVADWESGRKIEAIDLPESIRQYINSYNANNSAAFRTHLTVSVKTRIGYSHPDTKDWIQNLLETRPDMISLHGRTFKQLYAGQADWDEIALAAELCKSAGVILLGNGDVKSRSEGLEKVNKYGVHGVLIGRASMGNPWVFTGETPSPETKLRVALEQCEAFERLTPGAHFLSLRKHLAWYCNGFRNAAQARVEFLKTSSIHDVRLVAEKYLNSID